MWSSYVQNSPTSTIIHNATFMLFVFKTDQLDEDDLEDFLKRLLGESEAGLLRPYSWHHDDHDDDDWIENCPNSASMCSVLSHKTLIFISSTVKTFHTN